MYLQAQRQNICDIIEQSSQSGLINKCLFDGSKQVFVYLRNNSLNVYRLNHTHVMCLDTNFFRRKITATGYFQVMSMKKLMIRKRRVSY